MAYLFRQKFNITDLINPAASKKVLIFEPEEYLAGVYELYLKEHFLVSHTRSLDAVRPAVDVFKPHVLVFNIDGDLAIKFLLNLKPDFPQLLLVSTSFAGGERVKELMQLGVLGHINRRFSRPSDLAVIVKSIIN